MSEERMALSQKERDWLQWLHQAKRKQITQKEAALRMQVSERWVRKLLARMKRQKDRVVVHGLRGRPSNRRLAQETQQKAVAIVRAEYSDFGPTLAAEYLGKSGTVPGSPQHAQDCAKKSLSSGCPLFSHDPLCYEGQKYKQRRH